VATPTRRILVVRGAAVAGMVGPVLFALLVATLTVVQYDFMIGIGWRPIADPARAWPSGLALGPYGWVQSLSFAVSGLSLILVALGLHLGMEGGSRAGPALLLLSGVGMALLAFETDPIIRAGPRTLHGWVHDLSFVLLIVTLAPSFFFLWRRMERDPLWKGYGQYTLVTGLLAIPFFLLPGPIYYLSLALVLLWLKILGIRLWAISRRLISPTVNRGRKPTA
jgi:hypothetical protein